MQANLLSDPIGPTLAKLATPNIIAMFVALLTSMAEAFYVGQLGLAPLAGLALAFPIVMLTMTMAGGSIGGTISGAIAQQLGAENKAAAESIALHSILLTIILALAFSLIFLILGKAFYAKLGGTGEVLSEALRYSNVFFMGSIAIWVTSALNSIIRATGQMKVAAATMMAGSCIQIVASAIFIFGLGPAPALGIAGAAVGNVAGFAVSGAVQLWYLMRVSSVLRLRLRGIPIKFQGFWDILKIAMISAVSPLSSVATVIFITAMMARLGVDILAGYGVGARLEFLMIPIVFGIGSASITMVGANFGAGDYQRGVKIGWVSSFTAAALAGGVGITMAIFPSAWANLFSDVETVRQACRSYLQIVGPFYAFFGMGLCLYFGSQGARRMLWPVMGSVARLLVIAIGGLILSTQTTTTAEDFFWLISLSMVAYCLVTAIAIRLGAWTRHLPS